MSITVRLYSDVELKNIASGKDKFLATVFMNGSTFGEKEIKHYPYNLRKQYQANLQGADEPILFYAIDKDNAQKFIEAEYKTKEYPIVSIEEIESKEGLEKQIAELQEKLLRYSDSNSYQKTEYAKLKDKLRRRNLQIADLKKDKQNALHSSSELHARIDLLEDIIKHSGMWDYYCEGCFEYHKGNKEDYLKRCPKTV